MRKRNIFLALLFSIITCGLYWIYWFVKVTNNSNCLAPKHATMGGIKAIFACIFTLGIYQIYWVYRLAEKEGEMLNTNSPVLLYIVLWFFTLSIVPMCLGQSAINKALTLGTAQQA